MVKPSDSIQGSGVPLFVQLDASFIRARASEAQGCSRALIWLRGAVPASAWTPIARAGDVIRHLDRESAIGGEFVLLAGPALFATLDHRIFDTPLGMRAELADDWAAPVMALREGLLARWTVVTPDDESAVLLNERLRTVLPTQWSALVEVLSVAAALPTLTRRLGRAQRVCAFLSPWDSDCSESVVDILETGSVSSTQWLAVPTPPGRDVVPYRRRLDRIPRGTPLYHGTDLGGLQTLRPGPSGTVFASPSPAFAAGFGLRLDSAEGWVHGVEMLTTAWPCVYLVVPEGLEGHLDVPAYLYSLDTRTADFHPDGSVDGYEFSWTEPVPVKSCQPYDSVAAMLRWFDVEVVCRSTPPVQEDRELAEALTRHRVDVETAFEMELADLVRVRALRGHLYAWLVSCKGYRPSQFRPEYRSAWFRLLSRWILPAVCPLSSVVEQGYHSLEHLHFVGRMAGLLALELDEDPMPAMLAGVLHDLAREDDAPGLDHAEAAARLVEPAVRRDFATWISPSSIPVIERAIREHPRGRKANNYVEAALWDADRLRLAWERGYRARFFNTPVGAELARRGEAFAESRYARLALHPSSSSRWLA
ncbi:MAG: hypothetical protein Q8S73_40105 [Deltaproteobacteria bacterium]|nr:hypothetical protein [Myxococcales bacterium]MDP3220370.1 hypothetical protein [Deltaproteobacteria bacterium]